MHPHRRHWLLVGAATLANHHVFGQSNHNPEPSPMLDDAMIDADTPRFDPVPTLPGTPTPGRPGDFSGLGLRMLDVAQRQWSDHWVNARSGVITTPGQTGSFENGAGLFASTYEDQGKTVHSMGIWDCIGPGRRRWRQVCSADGGKTWTHDWVMHWRHAG